MSWHFTEIYINGCCRQCTWAAPCVRDLYLCGTGTLIVATIVLIVKVATQPIPFDRDISWTFLVVVTTSNVQD